jgi:hypothetical protein
MKKQQFTPLRFANYFTLLFLFGLFGAPSVIKAQVSGNVYHDVNANGTQQSSNPTEEALAGVTVTAYKPDGTSVTTTSSSTGTYSFTSGQIPSGTKVRIEFTSLPNTSSTRTIGGTSTQFVTAGAGATAINMGVAFANDQCQANPLMVTPCYVESALTNLDVVVKFSYLNTGTAAMDKTAITNSGQAGSMWGEAYSRSKKLIYMAAVLKTHVPLGAAGLDAIYTIDPFAGSPNATPWLQLTDDLGIAVSSVSANPQYATNSARGVDVSPQNDAGAFDDVGKVGLGDIELSADEKTLYIVNLYDKKLYAIDIATKTLVASYAIPNPGCSNGQARPWAVGENAGKIYVSVTCDGSSSGNPASLTDNSGVGNLSATVYRLDGSSFTQVLSFPLDYPRDPPFQYGANCSDVNRWKPWINVVPATCSDNNIGYPTPLLSDIEFDDNGNMILGFIDRTGFQIGYANYGPTGTATYSLFAGGDILKACATATGWSIESVGSGCSTAEGLAINTNDNDGYLMSWGAYLAKAGEFYGGDYFHENGNFDGSGLSYYPGHPEITIGGLAVVPGTGEVMSTSYDPVTGAQNYNTGGVITLSNTTGKRTRNGFQLYATTPTDSLTQGKGVGLGDLEALCDGAAIEIGNRVWNDTDQDGIQDPAESGIANVCLEVFADFNNDGTPDGAALGSTSTSATGDWLFNAANVADGDPSVSGTQAGLQPYKTYLVRVCASDWTAGEGTGDLTGLALTPSNTDATANGDERDNDAGLSNDIPQISVTTAAFGQSNFSLDMGFRIAPPCTKPTLTGVSADTATCTSGIANSDAKVHVTGIVGMEKYVYGTNGAATLYYANATASTATTIDITGLPNPVTATTYTIRLYAADSTCYNDTTVVLNPSVCPQIVNLTLSKIVDSSSVSVAGRTVNFTLKVKNISASNATGVTVKVTSGVGFTFVSAAPSVSYTSGTGIWTIGAVNAGDSVTLVLTVKADSIGVNYCTAEINSADQTDSNSTPNNSVTTEDDIARACVSVPMPLCPNQTYQAALPNGLTGIQWYKNGTAISGATNQTLNITEVGEYTFTANESTCPVQGCCPIKVIAGTCTLPCKPVICLPVAVVRQ